MRQYENEGQTNNQLDTSKIRKLNKNNESSSKPQPPPLSNEEEGDKKEKP